MDPATVIGDILREAPTVAAADVALEILIQLAQVGDHAAARALGTALAHKLGRGDAASAIEALPSLGAALDTEQIPALLRLYLVALVPREIAAHFQAVHALSTGISDADLYRQFQRLVRREDVVRHEVLKAYCLAAFVRTVEVTGRMAATGSMGAGAWQVVLDRILGASRVVPGDNADTTFSIGRELILGMNADGLLGVLFHELGHHMFEIMRALGAGSAAAGDATLAPTAEDLLALKDILPATLRKAQSAHSGRPDPVRHRVISMLFTIDRPERGPFLHGSLTLMNAPIPLRPAMQWTKLLADLFGVGTADVAVAHSPRGFFHFGIAKPVDPATLPWPRDIDEAKARLATLPSTADAWLGELTANGPIESRAETLAATLGLEDPHPRVFAVSEQAFRDTQVCVQLEGKSFDVAPEHASALMGIAMRCAFLPVIAHLMNAGLRPEPHLRELGSSFCVVELPGQVDKVFVGPPPAAIADVIAWLHQQGVDLSVALADDGTTLLHDAVRQETPSIAVLLAAGADPDRADAEGNTPLHLAIGGANEEGVVQLLAAGASPNRRNAKGETPLALAAALDDLAAIDRLLDRKAAPDARDANGATPLMSAASGGAVGRLIDAGARHDAADHTGRSALMMAAGWARDDAVRALLAAGAEANHADELGSTALHFAAGCRGSAALTCLALLLDAGADIDEETREGVTPLMLASHWGHADNVKALLARGADAEASDMTGNTPLLRAVDPKQQLSRNFNRTSDTAIIVRALAAAGADVNTRNDDAITALHLAARGFTSDLVSTLLELGAEVDPRNRSGQTPLMFAAAQGHADMVKRLIAAGADLAARDSNGETPLHYATRELGGAAPDKAREMEALLSAGATAG